MEKMVRYLAPQLKRTYDAVVRTLMPWRMIDALSSLDEATKRAEDEGPVPPSDERDETDQGPPTTQA